MRVRRRVAVLAAVTVIGTVTPAFAADPSPSPSIAAPSALYGTADPTYDGARAPVARAARPGHAR